MFYSSRLLIAAGAICSAFALGAATAPVTDLTGAVRDPFSTHARARVFLFVRTDCPITNRYAPELRRLGQEFKNDGVDFWLIYPDRAETPASIKDHLSQYGFPGAPLRDPGYELVRRAHATVAPEAAVFDASGVLRYHGRIDDRYVDIGKARAAAQTHDLEDAIKAVLAGKTPARAETRAVGCALADLQ
jgi:hypothetical protein